MARAQSLADIPDVVVRDLTHYTKDPEIILQHREQVSETITALQEKIGKPRAEQYRKRHKTRREDLEQEALQRNISRAKKEMK